MIDSAQLIEMYSLTHQVIRRRMEGLTQEESLVQPPTAGANCLNWLMGHIVATRSNILAKLGQPDVWTYEQASRYIPGSDAVDAEGLDALPIEEIMIAYDVSQELLVETLKTLSVDDLLVPDGEENSPGLPTLGGYLAFYHFHESYHLGQIDMIMPVIRAARAERERVEAAMV